MFDGKGFVLGVLAKGHRLQGVSALVVGACGVGPAIAASLAKAGVARLAALDANPASSQALADRLAAYPALRVKTGSKDPAGFGRIVNATPVDMNAGDPLPVDVARIDPGAFVVEVVLKSGMTSFLSAAERGCRYQAGTDMPFEQIPAYLDFCGFGRPAADELRRAAMIGYQGPPLAPQCRRESPHNGRTRAAIRNRAGSTKAAAPRRCHLPARTA